jgi:hypothetical protein
MVALTRLGPQRFTHPCSSGLKDQGTGRASLPTKNTLDQRSSRAPAESSDFFAGGKETWLRSGGGPDVSDNN